MVAREFTVFLRDANGQMVGVAVWPFDPMPGATGTRDEGTPQIEVGTEQSEQPSGGSSWHEYEGTQAYEWDAPHCPLKIRKEGHVCLREGPHPRSRAVTALLEGGTSLRAVSWEVKHESIEVLVVRNAKGEALMPTTWAGGVSQEVGWIGLEETVGYDGRRWFRGLTEEEWYGTPWNTSTAGLSVWVSKGRRAWGEVCDDILPTQDQSKRENKHLHNMRDVLRRLMLWRAT